MTAVSLEISNICRFCLCQDVNFLVSLEKLIDTKFTIGDIEYCTGVRIPEEETCIYAICETCSHSLATSVSFRFLCLKSNILFNQLFSESNDRHNVEESNSTDDSDHAKVATLEIEILVPDDQVINNTVEYLSNDEGDFDQQSFGSVDEWSLVEPNLAAIDELVSPSKAAETRGSIEAVRKSKPKNLSKPSKEKKSSNVLGKSKKLCGVCGAMVYDLKNHIRIHSKEKLLSCSLCNAKMADRSNLFRHVQAVHAKKVLKTCELCDKGFTSSNSYISHMQSQHGIGKTYECKICLKSFKHPSNYKDHFNRLHHVKLDYKCRVCGKLFKDRISLKTHRKVHSASKPFGCDECSKRFKTRYSRNTHQLTHSGIRYSCTLCTKSYKYKNLLRNHCKKQHSSVEPAQTVDTEQITV
ncbi:zinc finger protein-like [Anopheles ziemanni]|uniref:zinc finger protein-like n=1 Tax=Anopheles coustani TaxID=139045 RepID=UPI002657C526|nr:zinc finger protein-like [Anopheles coustani]XP_058170730.1 zinc finger protein-like [Anopheles ziemanni]